MTDHRHSQGPALRRRRLSTRRSVLLADRVARWVITGGGAVAIAAVLLVGLFLLLVALPLFRPGRVESEASGAVATANVAVGSDDTRHLIWTLDRAGTLAVRRIRDDTPVVTQHLESEEHPVCLAVNPAAGSVVFGHTDGTVRTGRVRFAHRYLGTDSTAAFLALRPGQTQVVDGALVERTREGQLRRSDPRVELDPVLAVSDTTLLLVDRSETVSGTVLAALDARRLVHVKRLSRRHNMLTGETTVSLRGGSVPLPDGVPTERPRWLWLSGQGDGAVLIWPDGTALWIDVSDLRRPRPGPRFRLTETGVRPTAISFQIGKSSLVVGDERGGLVVWYRRVAGADSSAAALVPAVRLATGPAAVTALAPSGRSRLLAVGYADGTIRLLHVTSRRTVSRLRVAEGPITAVAVSPRDDGLLAATPRRWLFSKISAPHPDVSVPVLLAPVWYEGYPGPALVWQTSSGSDDFEPKYSLVPLIFGTLKATFYSLLIALPMALLAALYTSELLHPITRARVKPVIETMASLPSVVLGLLGALVLAPVVENRLSVILAAVFTTVYCLLLGARLWQLIPVRLAARAERWRPAGVAVVLSTGLVLARWVGPTAERLLYGGNLHAWLDGQQGAAWSGWVPILLPLAGLVMAWANTRWVDPWLLRRAGRRGGQAFPWWDLGRFQVAAVGAVLLAAGGGLLLAAVGWDPRGSLVGTYVQRNALIVGFMMGFAVIPIIYTLAEDALAAVPDHLRAASLGAGATAWQTAVRVVIPPAASGLFSAAMIGLGRAVGETMIVLMAAGNTPLIDLNPFNGFRTLSATIAVELPEAVRDSTHYRVLFLAALTLLVMTFVINTAAELVRLHYRGKARQL